MDPIKIGNYWFTSSSERWAQGKTIILRYEEYNAEGAINIVEIKENKRIHFTWGSETDQETDVTILLREIDSTSTAVEITEAGFSEEDSELVNKLLGQKEGWLFMLCCLKAYLEHGINDMRGYLIH